MLGLYFYLPVFVLFFQSKGLGYAEILILFAFQSLVQLIFEIPCGSLSDSIGRKISLCVGSVLYTLAFLVIFIGNSFYLFLVGFCFLGLSKAFISGSDSAFIFDTLYILKIEDKYKKVEGKARGLSLFGMALGALCGGYIGYIDMSYNMLFTAFGGLLSIIIASLFVEPNIHHEERCNESKNFLLIGFRALQATRKKSDVLIVVLLSSVLLAFMQVSHRFFQPYLIESNISIQYFGYIYTIWMLFGSFSAIIAHYIDEKLGILCSLILLFLLTTGYILYMGIIANYMGLIIILAGEFTWGATIPIVYDYVNKNTKSSIRATVISFFGFSKGIILIGAAPFYGYLADLYSFKISLCLQSASVFIIGILLLFLFKQKYRIVSCK